MRATINCNLGDLEDTDTIAGYKAKDLIIFAQAIKNAGISNDELSAFVKIICRERLRFYKAGAGYSAKKSI